MRHRLLPVLVVALLVASGCASETEAPADTSAGAQTRTILVDSSPSQFKGAFLGYLPNEVAVRPGDTVVFKEIWTGEPHSVTMGTLIDAVLPKVAGPQASPAPDVAKAFEALPVMLPEGPGDANAAAVNACFLDTGSPPADPVQACPKVEQPAFNGRQSYYSSGFLEKDATFKVKLADAITPGDYWFYCNLHGADMSGYLEVKAKGTKIPSQADVDKAAQSQLAAAVTPALVTAYTNATTGKGAVPGNLAGLGDQSAQSVGVNEFIPSTVAAKAGQKVSWTIFGVHTISFNPPPDAAQYLTPTPSGYHKNSKSYSPAGGAGAPAPGSKPVTKPIEIKGGSFDGYGFKSSGFVFSFPGSPTFYSYSLTFTKPGKYIFSCLIHPPMAGTVEVT